MPVAPEGPSTYAQWSQCLDRLADGTQDEDCLEGMARGQLSWSGGVGPLFAQRVNQASRGLRIRAKSP